MPLQVTCSEGHTITLPESKAGQTVRCPQCRQQVIVPGGGIRDNTEEAGSFPHEQREAGGLPHEKRPPPLPRHAQSTHGTEPPAVAEPRPKRRGMRHDASQIAAAYWFGAGLLLAAVLGVCPAGYELVNHFRLLETSNGVDRWAFLLLMLGALQVAYAVYVMQLPDWGSVWVAALFSLLVAAIYATLLGLLLLSGEGNQTLAWLQLAPPQRQTATSWCFVMLSFCCLLTYLGGRIGAGWYRAFATISGIRG